MKKKASYANAETVLSTELFGNLQKEYTGLLWVPKNTQGFYEKRKQLITDLIANGLPNNEIAKLAGITERRVRQIKNEKNKPKAILGKSEASRGGMS